MAKRDRLNNGALSQALGVEVGQINPAVDLYGVYPNISYNLISLYPYLLSYTYNSYGFVQQAVNAPIEDAFRGGVKVKTQTLDSDEVDELHRAMRNDWEAIKSAIRWGRLFGGGVLLVNTEQKADRPLSESSLLGKKLEFIAADRWEATCLDPQLTPESSNFLYHGLTFDNSRVFAFLGQEPPYFVRMRLQGWGVSMLESILPQLNTLLKAQNVIFELLDESKIDVLKIKGLSQTLIQAGGVQKVKERVDIAAANKNFKSMLTMDAEDDYQQKQVSMAGFPELSKEIRVNICAALRMPEVKVFGVGDGGFSNGQDKLELYNSLVESEIRYQAEPLIKKVIDLRCMQMFGRKLPDLELEWQNLRVMPEEQEAEIKTKRLHDMLDLYDRGLISPKGVWEAIDKEGLVSDVEDNLKNLDEEPDERVNEDFTTNTGNEGE